jgi:16S rRNA (cytosine1402-N4)-methyltransferase
VAVKGFAEHRQPTSDNRSSLSVHHVPVLADAVAHLAQGRRRAVDGTVGAGGHAALLLAAGADLLAVDADPVAVTAARARLDRARARVLHGRHGDPEVLAAVAAFRPDLVLLDLGVSSYQLDDDERGFSFRPGVPLDMRMDSAGATTGADVLNDTPEAALRDLFRQDADERRAGSLARAVTRRRQRQPFAISDDLVNAVRQVLGPRSGPADFARVFQAVRMAVNDERGQLERALPALRDALEPGGVLAVISYHSGEDRVVKRAFRSWAQACECPPEQPVCTCRGRPLGRVVPPVVPAPGEVASNPRARSARLRAFLKDDAA